MDEEKIAEINALTSDGVSFGPCDSCHNKAAPINWVFKNGTDICQFCGPCRERIRVDNGKEYVNRLLEFPGLWPICFLCGTLNGSGPPLITKVANHGNQFVLAVQTCGRECFNKLRKYSLEIQGTVRSCQGCEKMAPRLMKCSLCGCAFYCSKACQAAAWPTHKLRCSGHIAKQKEKERSQTSSADGATEPSGEQTDKGDTKQTVPESTS